MMRDVDTSAPVLYEGQTHALEETLEFAAWLGGLRDRRAKVKVIGRIQRAADGNFGDHRSVGGGVHEMRVYCGPGYRVYYCQRGKSLVLLLCGGDKNSQDADIIRAKELKAEIEQRGGNKTV